MRETCSSSKDAHIYALVFSEGDEDESAWARRAASHTRLLVATEGAHGGRWWGESEGHWAAAPLPGPTRDAYGCGDSFAAAFTLGLGRGDSIADAAKLGAEAGALRVHDASVRPDPGARGLTRQSRGT